MNVLPIHFSITYGVKFQKCHIVFICLCHFVLAITGKGERRKDTERGEQRSGEASVIPHCDLALKQLGDMGDVTFTHSTQPEAFH